MPYADTVTNLHDARIDKLVAGGDGLTRMEDGRVVFVPGVVAGESVRIELSETRRDFARARVHEVLEASPHRVEPPCRFVGAGCGGCDWQHIERRHQGQAKLAIVTEAYARTARMDVEPQLRRIPEDARRTTVRMVADGDGRLGFRGADSHDIVAVESCMVAHDAINQMVAAGVLKGAGEVTIRVGARTGDVGVWCHEGALSDSLAPRVKVGERGRITEQVAGRSYSVSMGSFFQSSPEAAELIIDSVARRLDTLDARGGLMLDAYGGVGLFSLALADRFDALHLVESSASACRDAVRNLAECAAVIEQADVDTWESVHADVVVADPSRAGLGKHGSQAIVETDAPVVILVSCDPVAGARDAKLLCEAGYHLGEVEVLDIFPHTHHVEVVAAFHK